MQTRILLQLSQFVTQLTSRIEGVESRRSQRPLFSGYRHRPSPFTPWVQMEKRPPEAKSFKADKYKGTGDPHLHLETFLSLCSSIPYTDFMACHAFQETLSDKALSWFLNLPPNSINNFDQLSERFLNRFILHASIYRSVDALFHIKQQEGEGLHELLSRWRIDATTWKMSIKSALADQSNDGEC
ncbi:hypothetical protein ACLB2K_037284 [Fragaria x ananassa]